MIVYVPLLLPAAGKMVMLPLVQLTMVASREPKSTRPLVGTCWPLCGVPKLVPKTVIGSPHPPDVGVKPAVLGADCGVGVAVGPGVLVAIGVWVGVAVAPSGAKALKPEVLHGRRPSA